MEDARDFCRDLGRSVNGPVVGEACGDADDKDDELMSSSFRFDGDGLALDGSGVPGFTSTTSGLGRDTLRASALAALPASAPSFCISPRPFEVIPRATCNPTNEAPLYRRSLCKSSPKMIL